MFSVDQIQAIHSKVKSGVDFPHYIQELIRLGVTKYDHYLNDGHTIFFDKNNYSIDSGAKYSQLNIASKGDRLKLKNALKIHQQGFTDYLVFCKQAAEAGVEKWVVDTKKMTCSYYERDGNLLIIENIPEK